MTTASVSFHHIDGPKPISFQFFASGSTRDEMAIDAIQKYIDLVSEAGVEVVEEGKQLHSIFYTYLGQPNGEGDEAIDFTLESIFSPDIEEYEIQITEISKPKPKRKRMR